jgi:hypothetical protein
MAGAVIRRFLPVIFAFVVALCPLARGQEVTVGPSKPGGSSGQLQFNNSGAFGGLTIGSGLQNSSGSLICVAFGTSAPGCVPSSGGGTTNFLRADGAWAAPPSGGSATGSGVDAGYTLQTVTSGTTMTGPVTAIGSGWTSGTITLRAISTLGSDPSPQCVFDAGQNITGSATLTVAANGADLIGGSASVGPYGSARSICFVASAAHNWAVAYANIVPAVSLVTHQWLNSLSSAGTWGQSQPAFTDISGAATSGQLPADVAYVDVNQSFTAGQAVTPVALTDASTIAVNAALSNNFTVTLGGNRTLGNPSNLKAGQTLNFWVTQPSSGGPDTLAYGSDYQAPGGTATLVLSTGASAKDLLTCVSDTTSTLTCSLVLAVAH